MTTDFSVFYLLAWCNQPETHIRPKNYLKTKRYIGLTS